MLNRSLRVCDFLVKSWIYALHQIELEELINMMYLIIHLIV